MKSQYNLEPTVSEGWAMYIGNHATQKYRRSDFVRCALCKIAMYNRNVFRHVVSFHHEYFDTSIVRSRYYEAVTLNGTYFVNHGDDNSIRNQVKNWVDS
jgi:hypothetical protein